MRQVKRMSIYSCFYVSDNKKPFVMQAFHNTKKGVQKHAVSLGNKCTVVIVGKLLSYKRNKTLQEVLLGK